MRIVSFWLFMAVVAFSASAADVVVSALPSGMLQPPGSATAIDRFALTNTGATTSVMLSASASFFSVSPQSFTLGPGATQAVTIRAAAQAAGVYRGSVAVTTSSGSSLSVRVLLLVSDPPVAPVSAATPVERLSTPLPPIHISPAPPASLPISFTNQGTAVLSGLVTSDVPWILTTTDSISIAPGETRTIEAIVDPSRRPDGGTLGSAIGKVSLKYFSGSGVSAQQTHSGSTSGLSVTSVTVVDPNRPATMTGAPPPLAPGELALFAAGAGANALDLFMVNRSGKPVVSDVRLFYAAASGLPTTVAGLSPVPSSLGVHFAEPAAGSPGIQIRSGDLPSFVVEAARIRPSDRGAFVTALPLLRSDRGVGPREQIVLAGVAKDGQTQTDLVLQEVSGMPASMQIDIRSRSGELVSSRTESLAPFAVRELADFVPANAFSIAITNTSSGEARIGAMAVVTDTRTRDSWTITDPSAGMTTPDAEFLVPFFFVPAGAQLQVHFVNRSAVAGHLSFEAIRPHGRRRTATQSAGTAGPWGRAEAEAVTSVTLAAREGEVATVASPATGGYVRIAAAPGVIAGSARLVQTSSIGRHGASLPLIPAASAIAAGQAKRYTGIDDAATATVAAKTPLTFRSDLMLAEIAGSSVVLRLTIRFLISSATSSALASASRTLAMEGRQFLFLSGVAREILGPLRDTLGDLRNVQLDIEVVSGSGRIVSLVQSTENASGDLHVRFD